MSVPSGILAFFISRFINIPYFITLLGSDVPYHTPNKIVIALRHLIKRSWMSASKVIAQSKGTMKTACKTYPAASTEFEVIYSGVNNIFHQFQASDLPFQNGKNEPLRIVTLGRLLPLKGIHDVINALSMLREGEEIGEFLFTIIGNGPNMKELKQQSAKLNLAQFIHFKGFIEANEIVAEFNQSDFFILTSYSESMGMVFVEALACGIPVIGSNVGGIPEIIDKEVGLLVEPGNVKDIADTILIMSKTHQLYEKDKLKARASLFAWDSISAQYMNIYEKLVSNRNNDKA
jgi:glycosyltransferase involved in cell wall biosynthesis